MSTFRFAAHSYRNHFDLVQDTLENVDGGVDNVVYAEVFVSTVSPSVDDLTGRTGSSTRTDRG